MYVMLHDFQNNDEEKEFRLLASQLFKEEGMSDHMLRCLIVDTFWTHYAYFEIRTELFDRLVGFFPTEMTQPAGDKSVHKISVDTPGFFLVKTILVLPVMHIVVSLYESLYKTPSLPHAGNLSELVPLESKVRGEPTSIPASIHQ